MQCCAALSSEAGSTATAQGLAGQLLHLDPEPFE